MKRKTLIILIISTIAILVASLTGVLILTNYTELESSELGYVEKTVEYDEIELEYGHIEENTEEERIEGITEVASGETVPSGANSIPHVENVRSTVESNTSNNSSPNNSGGNAPAVASRVPDNSPQSIPPALPQEPIAPPVVNIPQERRVEYKTNNAMIQQIKGIINNNPSEIMQEFGFTVVTDSSIVNYSNQFTFTRQRVLNMLQFRAGTIRVYARDYIVNGEFVWTESFIM